VDFRPYPTASTRTRLSPASPASRAAASRRRGRAAAPIPATVWVPEPGSSVDPAAVWPAAIVHLIVSAFSRPGDEIVLSPWPHPASPGADAADLSTTSGASGRGGPGTELGVASRVAAELFRCPRVVEISAATATAAHPEPPSARREPSRSTEPEEDVAACGSAELLVTSMPSHVVDEVDLDAVAIHAARELCFGGILAVLTYCDWEGGHLRDPSGPMIAAAQNADLLYLQHIVVSHLPVPDLRAASVHGRVGEPDGDAADGTRPDDRAWAGHRRVHSDVLVFAQPHDHPAPAGSDSGMPW